jgi:NadR type nicotinamide-nucleotide adenylyltransferase
MEESLLFPSMKKSPKIVVITGAESTGKSVLTEALANNFNVPFIPEIARDYIEKLDRKYTYSDVETIARIQVEQFNRLKTSDHPWLFIDTWLFITKVWFDVVFGKIPDWIIETIQDTKIDLFLVCDIDLPWIEDPVRENGGEKRITLHKRYLEEIKDFNFRYEIIRGQNEQRFQNALQILKLFE